LLETFGWINCVASNQVKSMY